MPEIARTIQAVRIRRKNDRVVTERMAAAVLVRPHHVPDLGVARLARMCRHVPVGAIVFVGFALLNVASAIASILAVGPVNGMQ